MQNQDLPKAHSLVIQLKRIRKVSPTQGSKDGTEAMLHLRAKRVNVG